MAISKYIFAYCMVAAMLIITGCDGGLLIDSVPEKIVVSEDETLRYQRPQTVDLYLDASLSMKGYLVKKDNKHLDEYAYSRILDAGMSDIGQADTVNIFKCGTSIINIPKEQVALATQFSDCFGPECLSYFYNTNVNKVPCSKGQRDNGCVNQDSDIVMILNEIASKKDGATSIITSDLFLSTEKSKGFIGTAAAPLHTIFDRGDIIAILAIASRFDGIIYDVFPRQKDPYTGMHPVYFILSGPSENVHWILRRLEKRLESGPKATWHTAILTSSTANPVTMQQMLTSGEAYIGERVTKSKNLLSQNYAQVPQFLISSFVPDIKFNIQALGTNQNIIQSNLLSATVNSRLWEYLPSRGKGPKAWMELPATNYTQTIKNNIISYDFGDQTNTLPLDKTYFADIEMTSRQWEVTSTLPKWISEWSFTPGEYEKIIKDKPALFPTLNLKRVCETMADAASRGHDTTIARVQFVVRRTKE